MVGEVAGASGVRLVSVAGLLPASSPLHELQVIVEHYPQIADGD